MQNLVSPLYQSAKVDAKRDMHTALVGRRVSNKLLRQQTAIYRAAILAAHNRKE